MRVHVHMLLGRHVGLTNHPVGSSPRPETGDYMWISDSMPLLLTRHICLYLSDRLSDWSNEGTHGQSARRPK